MIKTISTTTGSKKHIVTDDKGRYDGCVTVACGRDTISDIEKNVEMIHREELNVNPHANNGMCNNCIRIVMSGHTEPLTY